jgi:hypothetical protein
MRIHSLFWRSSTVTIMAAGLVMLGPGAEARWNVHDEGDASHPIPPPGAYEDQTCTDRLRGATGFIQSVSPGTDPNQMDIPSYGYDPVVYHLWKAPPGYIHFNEQSSPEDVTATDDAGHEVQATRLPSFTTPPRASIGFAYPALGPASGDTNYVFTQARFTVPLPASVHPGDTLAYEPAVGTGVFVVATAIHCPAPLTAHVDVRPGSSANRLHPRRLQSLVPVRIFGSTRVDVTKIHRLRLGWALPADQAPAGDADHDGYPDRVYYFRQWRTGITCGQTHVRVTGGLPDHRVFKGTAAVTTAGCP